MKDNYEQAFAQEGMSEKADIVATAIAAGDFTALVELVEAAGLTETLQGEGPFTVFAPTDAAFAKLPAGTVEIILSTSANGSSPFLIASSRSSFIISLTSQL